MLRARPSSSSLQPLAKRKKRSDAPSAGGLDFGILGSVSSFSRERSIRRRRLSVPRISRNHPRFREPTKMAPDGPRSAALRGFVARRGRRRSYPRLHERLRERADRPGEPAAVAGAPADASGPSGGAPGG